MISVDFYLNETTRNANVLLPVPSPLERAHYDLIFSSFSIRNVAHYSKAVFDLSEGQMDEWEILLRLASLVSERSQDELHGDSWRKLDDLAILELIKHEVKDPHSPIHAEDPLFILECLKERTGPERFLDFYLRVGPYGDHFGSRKEGLSLSVLEAHPHGMDLGELEPRIQEIIATRSGKIELVAPVLLEDSKRLELEEDEAENLLLVGRRDLRSNNSWMHNLPVLVKGENRCTLWMHIQDAKKRGLSSGDIVLIQSRTGKVEAPVHITHDVMPGIVSLPHGWGHNLRGTRLAVASRVAGINMNLLTDEQEVDCASGNAVLNGISVVIEKLK